MTTLIRPGVLALISLETHSSKCIEVFKSFLSVLNKHVELVDVSSVYQLVPETHWLQSKPPGDRHEDLFCVALKVTTNISPRLFQALMDEIASKEIKENQQDPLRPTLLTYGDRVEMEPKLTLPHPELHTNAKFLIPVLDIWPEYFHGILETTLSGLSKGRQLKGEFFAQGKSLLDFHSSQT
jgi:7,8-dihydro-6-hydroxymethylpterin-pyrophosphokinase